MKHSLYYIICVVTALLGCKGGDGRQGAEAPADIKQTVERVMTLAAEEPERALEVIDSFRTAGLPDYEAEWLRAKVYSTSPEAARLDSAIVIAERLMEQPVAKENREYREDVLETLVNACRLRHDDERVLRWTAELVALCRERGEATEALRNEAESGLCLTHVGRLQEGLAKIDSVMTRLDSVRRFNELDAWLIAAKRKITVLKEKIQTPPLTPPLLETLREQAPASGRADGRGVPAGRADAFGSGEQIIALCHAIIDRLADYEQHPDDYHDGTYREPSDEDRQGYIDFYRAQTYGYLAEAYAKTLPRPLPKGRGVDSYTPQDSAHYYLALFEQSAYGQTLDGRKMIVPTWTLLGETEKMEAMYEDLTTARFRDYEQQMEIERQKAEASLWHIIAWLVAVIALLVACFAVYYFLRHREETRKNRILARQITEIVKLKAHPSPPEGRDVELHNVTEDTAYSGNQTSPPSEGLGEADLFQFLSQTIVREKLYLDAAFDRQAAIDFFHLSKERVGAAFAQGSDYASISDFINECRLEYAVNLLNDQPALPVSQVAQASGFSDANYFGRKFKARFGLSPTQFRKQ